MFKTISCDLPSMWDVGSSNKIMFALFWFNIADAIDNSWTYPPERMFALSLSWIWSRLAI